MESANSESVRMGSHQEAFRQKSGARCWVTTNAGAATRNDGLVMGAVQCYIVNISLAEEL
jgi:hypothetical protein